MKTFQIAPDVVWFPRGFVNVYAILTDEGPILVDTGLDLGGFLLGDAFEGQFGMAARAIILTHGHLDHVGAARELAERWQCRIYVHPLERPYLVGKSRYPEKDPTVGGPLGFGSRFVPWSMFNLTGLLENLPEDGSVPFAPDWRWLPAPGHTPGSVVLWHPGQKVLLAGDAVSTANFDTWSGLLSQKQQLAAPARPFTVDWVAVANTLKELAALEPEVVAAGHGKPMSGRQVAGELKQLAREFVPPSHGRYVDTPVKSGEDGLISVPPAPKDPFLRQLAALGLVFVTVLAVLGTLIGSRRTRR